MPDFSINPYMALLDDLVNYLPNDLITMDLIYYLIENSYFKVFKIRDHVDIEKF